MLHLHCSKIPVQSVILQFLVSSPSSLCPHQIKCYLILRPLTTKLSHDTHVGQLSVQSHPACVGQDKPVLGVRLALGIQYKSVYGRGERSSAYYVSVEVFVVEGYNKLFKMVPGHQGFEGEGKEFKFYSGFLRETAEKK